MDQKSISEIFQRWGYLQANLDSLGRLEPFPHRDLDALTGTKAKKWREIYCGPIGAEFSHIIYPERQDWVVEKMEGSPVSIDRNYIFESILSADVFERFLHTRYVGTKRFSLEGSTALIPLLKIIVSRAADLGFEYVMIGMAHRGRLNVMYNIINTPADQLLAGFEDVDPRRELGGGDVKYHKGATGTFHTPSGKSISVRLSSNPSHLEAVNPVIMGRVRARQERLGDVNEHKKILAVVMHGDAAFAGQGIAAETLNYMKLRGFGVGGTVHIVVNNLIGFTADPSSLHSSRFSSDIAKRLSVPIFHVNAEYPDAVARVGLMAMDYRADFKSDVVVDLIGYRRFGHSEIDDPTITLPVLYERIQKRDALYVTYGQEIGLSISEIERQEQELIKTLDQAREVGKKMTTSPSFFSLPDYWGGYIGGYYDPRYEVPTTVSNERLLEIADRITSFPEGFNVHPKILRGLEQRMDMAHGKRPVDWGMAEALAFGSLLWEQIPVRLVGQDSRRGTFNQRHSVLFDTRTSEEYIPLRHLVPEQARFDVYDSMLSEQAAVGFEYGFSRDYPEALVCWEAQFGDFANGAQIITDQFLTAGEDKWGLLTGLVLLLPHGFEGAGPEHSSARIERFLQLAAEDNIQVVQPSNAVQYFHVLRRQVLRKWRKPLVVFTPKSMLRLPSAGSPIEDFSSGEFQWVLNDTEVFPDAKRIMVCSGKIVHELRAERKIRDDHLTAIVTIEQLYPFPEEQLEAILEMYPKADTIVWVQEEPANMGALFFVRPILEQVARGKKVTTVRRTESASPATGSPKAHDIEQRALIKLAFARYYVES